MMVKVTKNKGGKRRTIGLYRNHIVVLDSTAVSSVHVNDKLIVIIMDYLLRVIL